MSKLFNLLIYIWIVITFLSISYNVVKVRTEIREWYFLSIKEKKEKLFGQEYKFLIYLKENIKPSSNVLFLEGDGFDFFFSRYVLYPIKIDMIWENSDISFKDINKFDILISKKEVKTKNFVLLEVYQEKNLEIKYIYKKK